jgi:hypothetical protein
MLQKSKLMVRCSFLDTNFGATNNGISNFEDMKSVKPASRTHSLSIPLLLFAVLTCLFWRSFLPDYVHFSNDGPLGPQHAAWMHMPDALLGQWYDLNSIGNSAGMFPPGPTAVILGALGPLGYSKFLAPAALFIVGLGAWFFFRQLKLSPVAATLGALAAMLNSTFFSDACWGTAAHEIALGMNFFALGLVAANTRETPGLIRWTRLALAGLFVGVNVMEGADVGALYSLFVAAFVVFKSLVDEDGTIAIKLLRGTSRVAIVAVFAGFIALQTVLSLVGTQIQGVVGTEQDTKTKAEHWDFVTQWSLPKAETIGILIPGLFGYKMDTPQNMMPALQDAYRGGVYWGGVGRDPAIDRFFDSGGTGSPPPGSMRFTGGGNYCGILVALIAAWTIAQSFRRQNSPFTGVQKKFIWFWGAALFGSLLLAWGRFAPIFYSVPYQLPYFSTIRNPAKFLFFLSWAVVILFAYGIHALNRRYLEIAQVKSSGFITQLLNWWAKADKFDRRWTFICGGIFGASALGWFIYGSEKAALLRYLQARGFPDADFAQEIIAFSIGQAGWWLVLFAAALGLLTLVLAGCFAGPRAKWGGLLLGGFLVVDLGRANLPYIIHWDYKQKYEVGSLNPIEEFLKGKPYEHRVAGLPFETQQPLHSYDNAFGGNGIYRIEWMQQHFPYYNIQCFDIIQMPRMPEDLKSYLMALSPHGTTESAPLYARQWQLTNTRYLLGTAGYLDAMNQQLDPGQHRFRIAQRFDIVAKPGISRPTQLEELTAVPASDGDLALFEFTGALPRAKLFSNWQINTNDQAVLNTLADLNFDPAKTVLVETPLKNLPLVATNENSGTVEFKSYSPKHIVFDASAPAPSILLLNDKYDPNWQVTVDGQPAELLRCNYIMRGVYLPAGSHTVEFQFSLPHQPLYGTLSAIATGFGLLGLLIFLQRRKPGA